MQDDVQDPHGPKIHGQRRGGPLSQKRLPHSVFWRDRGLLYRRMTKRTSEGQKEIFNREAWDRSLLHGLACEWENSLWVLSPSHRKMMRPPLFSLREMEDRWGSWLGKKREISLSRNLVLNHPWDAVCEVLLHEIAHQFTEEVFAAHHEPPHGPQFQKACHLLRANPNASRNDQPLNERIAQGSAG